MSKNSFKLNNKLDHRVDSTELVSALLADLEPYLSSTDMSELSKLTILRKWDEALDYAGLLLAERPAISYSRFVALRQFEAFLKKNVSLEGGRSSSLRKAETLSLFLSDDEECGRTNVRFLEYLENPLTFAGEMVVEAVHTARQISSEILGEIRPSDYSSMLKNASFGPGLTFDSTDPSHRHLVYKVGGRMSVTKRALPYARHLFLHFPRWACALREDGARVDVVRGNRVTTVPKTAQVDRAIAIEPSINIFLQKGVDNLMRNRLLRYGCDLRDQSRNQDLAREASIDGSLSTVDLSSASDTISREIVRFFLPSDWYALCDDIRSHEYTIDGENWSEYQKFSSMGNATTFPIESLIFYSVALAVTRLTGGPEEKVSVYGDDIIIPRNGTLLLFEVLSHLGFRPNTQKSFALHEFRESCGEDFINGVQTRPVYISKLPKSVPEVYNLFNRLLNNRCGLPLCNVLRYLYTRINRPDFGPRYLGAGDEWTSWEPFRAMEFSQYFMVPSWHPTVERLSAYHVDWQERVWRIRSLNPVNPPLKGRFSDNALYSFFLLGGRGDPKDPTRIRWTRKRRTITRWPDDGYWPMFLQPGVTPG
nr:MAG: RNA dependent RNA polymerase [Leviviridae sp.]